MKKIFFPLLMLCLAGLPAMLSAQTADEIIGKYIDAIGGRDNLKKINSISKKGFMESPQGKFEYTENFVNGRGYRFDMNIMNTKMIQIVTPEKGWQQNPGNLKLLPMTQDELLQQLLTLDIQDPLLDYKEKGSTIEYLGRDEDEGNEYHKIKMVTKNQQQVTYFFDLKTNLIYKNEMMMKADGQEIPFLTKFFDYKFTEVGVKMPYKIEFVSMGGAVMVTETVAINPVIEEALFTAN